MAVDGMENLSRNNLAIEITVMKIKIPVQDLSDV